MRPTVVVAETISERGIEALQEHCEVVVAAGVSLDELLGHIAQAQALIVRSGTSVDRQMIAAGRELKVIGRAGIGVDNIDIEAATEAGILVVNAPQANTISAAEHTMALLLGQARNIPAADASLRAGVWDRKSFQGVELHGRTLGIVGLGRIGSLVALRALSFGMLVKAYDPYVGVERARQLRVELVEDLNQLYEESDFISLHLPFTRETTRMIDGESISRMRPGVRIVNVSRGGILDEDALADAIRSGQVGGAALDVFAQEPLRESPLFGLPQVVVTPHLGASTREAQDKAGTDVAEAVAAALRGELVMSAVNVDIGSDVSDEVRRFLPLAEYLGRVFVALARGLPERLTIRVEGRLAEHPVRPLRLAALKGALSAVSSSRVSYVNAQSMAERRGIRVIDEGSTETNEYVSLVRLAGEVGEEEISLAGTLGRKAPMVVEMLGFEVELPLSQHMLIVRSADVPGMIGRVATLLGEQKVNIANMVVGRATIPGEAQLMGLDIDQALDHPVLETIEQLPGVQEIRFVQLPMV